MAKRKAPSSRTSTAPQADVDAARADGTLIAYAQTIGTTIGHMQNHVDSWNGQRKQVVKRLARLLTEAESLLADLGHQAAGRVGRLTGRRPKTYKKPDSNPAGALKPARRTKGVTEARRAAMSVEPKPRGTRIPSARAANR